MKVKKETPAIVRYSFQQEENDPDYGLCLWAFFDLDIERYILTITSDCGDYAYGWSPTPKRESFLRLCCRMDRHYILGKLSDRTKIDYAGTLENAVEYLRERLPYDFRLHNDDDWEQDFRLLFPRCEEEAIVYRYIQEFAEDNGIYIDAGTIGCCIEKDYSANAKKIVDIFCGCVVPLIREELGI